MKPEHLKNLINEGKAVRVLDVREKDEYKYADKKMDIAENMPMAQVFVEAANGGLSKDVKIVTVCKSGARCEIVARELRQHGFDIESLEGGIEGWKKVNE